MNKIATFSEQELNILKDMIGKRFEKFKCDPFIYSPMVYGIVGLYVEGIAYRLTSLFQIINRFFSTDDMAVLCIEKTTDTEIKTFMDEGELIDTPVSSKIVSIDVITDHQFLEHEGVTKSLDYSIGIIFHLEDSLEISFEIKTWFSEMITIEKGYNLIEKFKSIDDFLEEWEGCDGYVAKSVREIITLK